MSNAIFKIRGQKLLLYKFLRAPLQTRRRVRRSLFKRTKKTVWIAVVLIGITAVTFLKLISGSEHKNVDSEKVPVDNRTKHKRHTGQQEQTWRVGVEQQLSDRDPEDHARLTQEAIERLVDLGLAVKNRCRTLPVDEDIFPIPRNFFYFEAGTSSFLNAFLLAGGVTEEDIREKYVEANARALYPVISIREFMQYASSSTHIIIVRHPWTRLLSSYRSKIEQTSEWDPYFLSYVGTNILLHTRHLPEGVDPERARMLAKQAMDHLAFGTLLPEDNPYRFPTLRPTFREFLEYVAEFYKNNEHWVPVREFCSPCNKNLNYHVIKYEEYVPEVSAVLYEFGVGSHVPRHDNPTSRNATYQTKQLVATYFRNIETSLLNRLYANYRDDFLLFDYAPDQFFDFKVPLDG